MKMLSIKVRFEIQGLTYSFVMDSNGIEIVWLEGNTDRPDVLKVIYSGFNIRVARNAIKALEG